MLTIYNNTNEKKAVAKVNEQVYAKYTSTSNIKTVYEYNSVHGMVSIFKSTSFLFVCVES